jgi:uncharacterized protein (DUF983 family)
MSNPFTETVCPQCGAKLFWSFRWNCKACMLCGWSEKDKSDYKDVDYIG